MLRRFAEWSVIAILGVLLLFGLELSVRAWGRWHTGEWPQTRMQAFYDEVQESFSLYRRHAFLNTAPREGHAASAFGKKAAFNSLGYRSPERPVEKPPGIRRIVVAGGSTTFDLLAENNDSTWPWLLEQGLRAGGCDVEVWNAGFPGWTSAENVISLLLRDLDLSPDLVILFQGINDLQAASLEPFDRQYESHAAEARRALGFELPPLAWSERSLLLEKLRSESDPWNRIGPGERTGRQSRIPDAAVRAFERNVRAFKGLAQARGAQVLLMTQTLRLRSAHLEGDRRYLGGWLPGLEPSAAAGELERLNEVLYRVAQGKGREHRGFVDLVDLASSPGWSDVHFGDPMHFTEAGSRRLVDLLAPAVLEAPICAGGS